MVGCMTRSESGQGRRTMMRYSYSMLRIAVIMVVGEDRSVSTR